MLMSHELGRGSGVPVEPVCRASGFARPSGGVCLRRAGASEKRRENTMKRTIIPALVAVVAGGDLFTAASASAQGYNDYPSNTNRNYGQQNQNGYNQPNYTGQNSYDQNRSGQSNNGRNSQGSYGQNNYGQRTYGQDNNGQNYRNRNEYGQRYGAGRNDNDDRYGRGDYRNRYNGDTNGTGLGRNYRPGDRDNGRSNDNE
jgi:hypothetical protein